MSEKRIQKTALTCLREIYARASRENAPLELLADIATKILAEEKRRAKLRKRAKVVAEKNKAKKAEPKKEPARVMPGFTVEALLGNAPAAPQRHTPESAISRYEKQKAAR